MSQRRRMKTREEGTGATRLSLSSPVWAMLWGWVTSGGSPTSATGMEEVHIKMSSALHGMTHNGEECERSTTRTDNIRFFATTGFLDEVATLKLNH